MQCPCGGMTIDREVVRKKVVVGLFAECKECGRIQWLRLTPELKEEIARLHKASIENDH